MSAMFPMGMLLEVELLEPNEDRSYVRGEVTDHEGTLLKMAVEGRTRIFNTAAPTFLSAQEYRKPSGRFAMGMPPKAGGGASTPSDG